MKYTTEELEDISKNTDFFEDIFDQNIGRKLTVSERKNTEDGKVLYFTFSNKNPDIFDGKSEYDITIKDSKIIRIEYRSYPITEDEMTQQTITTYSDFNTVKSIDTDSVIQDMKKQAKN